MDDRQTAPSDPLDGFALPPMQDRTIKRVLEARVAATPDKTALVDTERALTYAELFDDAQRLAAGLRHLGIDRGDIVVTMLGSHADAVVTWIALAFAGAIAVPTNPSLHGPMLEHMLRDSGAATVITEPNQIDSVLLAAKATGTEVTVVVRGEDADLVGPSDIRWVTLGSLRRSPSALANENAPWDPVAIMYTSGTTGLSKGVLTTEAHAYGYATPAALGMARHDDTVLVVLPLHHVAGLLSGVYNGFIAGATIHLRTFSVSSFWDDVERSGATCTMLVDAMVKLLLHAPATATAPGKLQRVCLAPITDASNAFMDRFGIEACCSGYGSTETSAPMVVPLGSTRLPNSIGWPRPDFEVRVLDENDQELPDGHIGEFAIRPREPWIMMNGYWGAPQATVERWRNLWFHTGDLVERRAEEGQFILHGRMNDAIRRRGENISAVIIEQEAMACSGVVEAAAIGVPDTLSGHEVLLAVQTDDLTTSRPEAAAAQDVANAVEAMVLSALNQQLPAFMVPRYVRVVDGFERSVSGKIRRDLLRDEGLAPGTWDRQRGLRL